MSRYLSSYSFSCILLLQSFPYSSNISVKVIKIKTCDESNDNNKHITQVNYRLYIDGHTVQETRS